MVGAQPINNMISGLIARKTCILFQMKRPASLERLSELAREQAGYATAAQAKRLGMKGDDLARMARRGDLRRVERGVYALPGSFASPRERTIAAWLRLSADRLPWDATDPRAFISHKSAAALHGFGTLVPSSPTVTVVGRRFQPPDHSLRLYTAQLEPSDWQWLMLPEGIALPVTTPARTIVDLAYDGEERSHVLDAMAEARERGLIDDQGLAEAIARRRARRGRGSVAWLDEVASRT
jgi:predicted transcriptional regulator of viral defense system